MRRAMRAAVGLAALLAAHTSAGAQFIAPGASGSSRPIHFAFGGGVSVPTGDWKDALKSGFNGQGSIIVTLGGFPLALRGDLNYNRFSFKDQGVAFPGQPGTVNLDDVTQQIFGGLANVSVPFFGLGPVTPYVTAGLGAFNVKTDFGDGYGGDGESETKFAVNGGAGVSIRLFGVAAFIEAKINNIYTEKGPITTQQLKDLQFIPVTFGFVF